MVIQEVVETRHIDEMSLGAMLSMFIDREYPELVPEFDDFMVEFNERLADEEDAEDAEDAEAEDEEKEPRRLDADEGGDSLNSTGEIK